MVILGTIFKVARILFLLCQYTIEETMTKVIDFLQDFQRMMKFLDCENTLSGLLISQRTKLHVHLGSVVDLPVSICKKAATHIESQM